MDYNQPWGWDTQPTKKASNVVAPLGSGQEEPVQGNIVVPPSEQEKLIAQGKGQMAEMAIEGAIDGTISGFEEQAAASAADAAMAADAVSGATDLVGGAAGEAGASMMGPLAAGVGGIMQKKYDKAAGSIAGAAAGSMFGPLGTMAGSYAGGMLGDAVGNLFGFEDGTEEVKGYANGGMVGNIVEMANSIMARAQPAAVSPTKVAEPVPGFQAVQPQGGKAQSQGYSGGNPWATGNFNYYSEGRSGAPGTAGFGAAPAAPAIGPMQSAGAFGTAPTQGGK